MPETKEIKPVRRYHCRRWLLLLLLIVIIVLGFVMYRKMAQPVFIVPLDFAQLGLPSSPAIPSPVFSP